MNNEQIARGPVLSIIAELDKRDAEIEQLRKKIDQLADEKRPARDRLSTEIELLRGSLRNADTEIERLRGQADLRSRNFNHCINESARLRELLQQAMIGGATPYWYECVRKALGDAPDQRD